ncbi:RHS repeat-associated core domain-containing protein [Kitasatospora sp. NPDC047058]|uniref:RHS repeat-associated core domain-containing protein n=1 Tax=Kitasatospora sp. NPDC047058 TaxID=3155620 RepID=UPI00340204C9
MAVPPAVAWTLPEPSGKVWTPPNTPLGDGTRSVQGRDAKSPAAAPSGKAAAWKPEVAAPVITGTETVTLGADSAEAKAARNATGGASPASGGATGSKAGALAVTVAPATGTGETAHTVRVQVTGQDKGKAAGVATPLVALSDADATPVAGQGGRTANVTLDLKALQAAGWADRAALVSLPPCALTTPERAECRTKTPVPAKVDGTGKITADVTLPPTTGSQPPSGKEQDGTVKASFTTAGDAAPASSGSGASAQLVLSADPSPSGPLGNFAATPLSPSAAWSAGSNAGNFTYNYPIQVPPSLGGAAPSVALGYNSAAVDGKTSATNAQPSWIGDGWNYEPGYIERSYKSCDKAGITGSADQCWAGQNATLSLGDHSGTLVRDDATGTWHLQNDDGSKVEQFAGAPRTVDGVEYRDEYWRISTTDGTQYYFGRNRLPDGDGTDKPADSVLTMPVYSPNSADLCYKAATGTGSWCQLGWRWQLDFVVDAHGNLTTYKYATESNKYSRGAGQNRGSGSATSYQRSAYLTEIGYGQRLDEQKAAKGTLNPAAKILFKAEERCFPSGTITCAEDQRVAANADAWPDVPIDQICTGATCTNGSPTFFTTKRLTEITTQALVNAAYRTVDTWKLNQQLADPGDGTKRMLQLDSIQRVPSNGQAPMTDFPAVKFGYTMMRNRVDGLVPAAPEFRRPRVNSIQTETGASINVIYSQPECSRVGNHMPASEDHNAMACMPVKWYLPGQSSPDPVSDWFNKPLVTTVTVQDLVSSPAIGTTTEYTYGGGAAWHRNDAEFVDPKTRSWDNFRGYQTVTTTTGSGSVSEAPKTQQKVTYLRGMLGDLLANGTVRTANETNVSNPLGGTVTDSDWQSGRVVATEVYDKAGGSVKVTNGSHFDNIPGDSLVTATHAQSAGAPKIFARHAEADVTALSRTKLADGSDRVVTTVTSAEPLRGNRIVKVDDKGDGTAAAPETCTTTSYATSDNPLLLNLVAEQVAVQGTCGSPTAANTISASRTLYDGKALGQAGTTGNPTSAQILDRFDQAGNPVYVHSGTTAFDAYGRSTSSATTDGSTYDRNGAQLSGPSATPAVTTVALTPASGALPTEIRTTGPMGAGWTTTITQDPARGSPLTTTDVNGRVTTAQYDAAGRTTAVWAPGRPTSEFANKKFTYELKGSTKPSTVKTESLNEDKVTYSISIDIYDGLGRPRQSQKDSVSKPTGRLITDTVYDTHGWVIKTSSPYYNQASFPSTSIFEPQNDSQVPSQTWNTYDGNGRVVRSEFRSYANLQWATTTAYPGADRTDVTPPSGATPTSTVTDARGRTVAAWQYRTPTATGNPADADVTTYGYTAAGLPSRRTDSSGNNWTYTYDLRGRQVSASDPDTGTTRTFYNPDSQIDHTTDANGTTLAYTYDLLGRKTGLYNGSVAPANQLASWAYDTLLNGNVVKGQPTSSTRYVGGADGAKYVKSVTDYDIAYRPLGTSVTIPAGEKALAGTYTTTNSYNPILGTVDRINIPAAGGLPAETVSNGYTITGLLTDSMSLGKPVVAQVAYDALARPTRTTIGEYGTQVVSTQQYDWATGRVINSFIDRQVGTVALDQTSYTYAPSGRITSVTDLQNASSRDSQCFTYDHLGRLTRAWSDTAGTHTTADWTDSAGLTHGTGSSSVVPGVGGCNNADGPATTGPGTDSVGGPAPYWQDYTYDATGNRTGFTQHGSASAGLDASQVTQVASAADGTRTWSVALANGALWVGSQSAEGSWSQFGDLMAQAGSLPTVTAVSAAVSGGKLQVMAIAGGKIWHTIRQDDGTWQHWGDVYGAVGTLSDPSQLALTATASGLEVLTFSGGKLWHTLRMPDGNWQSMGWGDVYANVGALTSPGQIASAATASGLEITVSAGGKLWHTLRKPDGYWQSMGWGDVYANTGVLNGAQTGQGQLALANTNDGLQVIALAQGKPWHVVRNSAGYWSAWGDVTGAAGQLGPVGAVSASGVGDDLSVITAGSGKVSQTRRNGTTMSWSAWALLATPGSAGSSTTQTFGAARSANTPTTAPNTGGGTGGPHALLTSTTTTPSGTKAVSYQYDAKGNTTAITDTGGTTTLTWNGEDKLSSRSRTGEAGATTYLYDADGNQLIRRNPGKTTLNLPTDELTLDTASGSMSNVRSLGAAGGLTYTRVTAPIGGGTVLIQAADPHGTNGVQINTDAAQTVTRRTTDPFGNPRGTEPAASAWAGTKGFVGGSKDDSTGLTNLGARQYDPTTGRFISPDPILDGADPQQWNGYAYSENDPVNLSDPSGLKSEECGTLYDCGSAGTITTSNTQETGGYVSVDAQHRYYETAVNTAYTKNQNYVYEQVLKNGGVKDARPKGTWQSVKSLGRALLGFFSEVTSAGDFVDCGKGSWTGCMWAATSLVKGKWIKGLGEAIFRDARKAPDLPKPKSGPGNNLLPEKCNSFPPDTRVLMADGTAKAIGDIEPGEYVTGTDPQTSQTAAKPVTAKIVTPDDTSFTELTLVPLGHESDPGAAVTLVSTSHHPYWDDTTKRWTDAALLATGDHLSTHDLGPLVVVGARSFTTSPQRADNLTVADLHTYYVLAGNTPVLVHNSGCGPRFEVDSKGNATDLTNPGGRVGVPSLDGGTLQEVGGRIWGSGDPSHLIGTRSPTKLRGLASRGDAEKLQDFYRSAELAGKGGKTAPARVTLTQEIIDAWR